MSEDQWNTISAIKDSGTIEGFTKFWIKRCGLPDYWKFEGNELMDILVNNIALDLFKRNDWWQYFGLCKKYDNTMAMFTTIHLMQMRYKINAE